MSSARFEVQFPPMRSCAVLPEDRIDVEKAELPEFIPAEYLADGSMEAILIDRTLPRGALYFITPSARARPAKVEALIFLAERLAEPGPFGLHGAPKTKRCAPPVKLRFEIVQHSRFVGVALPGTGPILLYKRRFQAQ